MLIAQAEGLGSSTGILGVILSGAVLTAIIGAYRFLVNFRTTERGLNRQRMREATRGQRMATYESTLWQGRCADLEYLLRRNGIPIPPYSEELNAFIKELDSPTPLMPTGEPPAPDQTGGRQEL